MPTCEACASNRPTLATSCSGGHPAWTQVAGDKAESALAGVRENRAIGSIQPRDVRSWIAGLTASGLAPATVRAIYLTFGQILETAQIDGHIARSPLIGTKQALPKQTSQEEMHFLNAQEIKRLAE